MKTIYTVLLALLCQLTFAQSDFITRWNLSTAGSGATQLSFGVATSGSVSYTWTEVSPGTATGSGVFSGSPAKITGLPAGAIIELSISPVNFQRFFISNDSDKNRLTDVSQWGTTAWTSMLNAFWGCANLQVSATDVPDLSGVTDMSLMFRGCAILNGPANINTWNTGNVTSMFGMFLEASVFNQPLGNWNTQNVMFMSNMFRQTVFNQPIGNWNTGNVKYMEGMFQDAINFNQNIGDWNVQNVANMTWMFGSASAFNQSVGNWTLNPAVNTNFLFHGSGVTCYTFSETLKGWSANPATPNGRLLFGSHEYSPSAAAARNNLVVNKGWQIDATQSGTECLGAQSYFNTRWDLSLAGSGATQLNFEVVTSGDVNYTWTEVSPGTATGSGTFSGSTATITGLPVGATIELQISPANFGGMRINNGADKDRLVNVSQWGTTSWSSMAGAFHGCVNLNVSAADIPDLSLVTDLSSMFNGCTALNGPLNIDRWNTQNVTNMSSMFNGAGAFDRNIGGWNTQNVTDMSSMFNGAAVFDQSLGNWTLNAAVNLASIFDNSGLGCYSYSETLKGWGANPATPGGRNLEATGKTYSPGAENARNHLINTKGWTITGDTPSGAECSPPLSVTQFVTRWNLSTAGSGATQLSFGAATSGPVSYTWTEISPGSATGSGTFDGPVATITDIPSGATIELRIAPTHFERFMINNGADRNRLVEVSQWGATVWSSMAEAFYGCAKLKINATDIPNLSIATDMSSMFNGCTILNGPLNIANWNTQNMKSMAEVFRNASAFNQPIGNWNTGQVTSFSKMFNGASAFNQPIGNWDTQSATNMSEMFSGASAFNQNISSWNTGNVTTMNGMLRGAGAFNQPIGSWNTAAVLDMALLFRDAIAFNQPIGSWITQNVTNMSGMFQNAGAFNRPLGWDTQNVANMSEMFRGAGSFNQSIDVWNTQNVTDMSGMFQNAGAFNKPVGNWNTQSVTNMSLMFQGAGSFNQSTGNWTLNAAVTLTSIFTNSGLTCNSYSETLKGWAANPATPTGRSLEVNGRRYNPGATDARNHLTTVKGWTIEGDIAVDTDCATPIAITEFVTRWDLSTAGSGATQLSFGVTTSGPVNYTWTEITPGTATGSGTFNGSTATITGLPAGAAIELRISPANFQRIRINNGADRNRLVDVTQWGRTVWVSMGSAFSFCGNLQISATDVPNLSIVTDMYGMFIGCGALNGPANINSWNTQNVQEMSFLFSGAHAFNQPINNWKTQNVTNMSSMFREARAFNQPIGNWNTQNVTLMDQMFATADVFNQPIGNWNTQKVSSMLGMFNGALAFNQPIGAWNTQNVTSMGGMFREARAFNQPIGNWNTQKVTVMGGMFQGAAAFNQPIGNWNIQMVANLNSMFNGASAFDQSLGNWTLNASEGLTSIFTNSGLSCYNYSETLKGWGASPSTPDLRTLDAIGRTYSPSAAAARNNLINTKGWTISGDTQSETECLVPVSSNQFITRWNLSTTGSGTTQLSFGVVTSGSVSYVWTEVPSSAARTAATSAVTSGMGTFSGANLTITDLPEGATIELRILPENFRGIQINNGPDKNRLVDVRQWGTTAWSSLAAGFYGCTHLQISATDVPDLSGVDNLSEMFRECTILNGPANIGSWNVLSVTDMTSMFLGAAAFNQSLGNWALKHYAVLTSIFTNSGLDCYHYSETLKGWSAEDNLAFLITLSADGRTYSPSAADARNNLIENAYWTITGDAASETECTGTLPVSLVSFSGQKNDENQNVLKWATTGETDFDRFEIQSSYDATGFQTIGIERGQRSNYDSSDRFTQNQGLNTYTFTDSAPGLSKYYRLRMVDTDGSFEYSRIIYIDNRLTQSVVGSFYPNPSSGPVFVDVYAQEGGQWTVTVVTASGRIAGKRTYELQKGKNTLRLEHFVAGVNLVRFEHGGFLQVRKAIRE